MPRKLFLLLLSAMLSACMTASEHKAEVSTQEGDALTVGKVQREIHTGMSGAEVASVLGTPNIVTTDEQRREVWIYDRVSTITARSESRGGIGVLVLGVDAGGLLSGQSSSGASSTTQRTLTIIIKFDENKMVRDFSYHATQF